MAYADLINQDDGTVNVTAYRSMCRARALREYGAICPRSLRDAGKWYRQHINAMQDDWKRRHGVARVTHAMSADLAARLDRPGDGVRREV